MINQHKFSTDSLLLYGFIKSKINTSENILEIGCGGGEICFLLSELFDLSITGIDINSDLIELANNEKFKLIHTKKFLEKVNFQNISLQQYSQISKSKNYFDRIYSNPPFYKKNSSRPSPKTARKFARQDDSLNLEDIFKYSSLLLKNKGYLDFIFPSDNLSDIFFLSDKYKFNVIEIQPVYTKKGKEAKRIIIECRKNVKQCLKISEALLYYEKH